MHVHVPTRTSPQQKEAMAEAATSTANAQQSEAANVALRAQLTTAKDRDTALQQQLQQQQQQYQQQLQQQQQMQQQQQQHQQQLGQLQQQLQQLRDDKAVELLRLQAASTSQEEMMGVFRAKRESIAASAAQLQQLERSRECCICFGVMGGGDLAALRPCPKCRGGGHGLSPHLLLTGDWHVVLCVCDGV
jgi:hypothetical protein